MDSSVSTPTLVQRTMPVTAILWHELRSLRKSWIVRLWLVLAGLVSFLFTFGGGPNGPPSAMVVAQLLAPFLVFPWFLVVMMIGINPVTGSRSESLADGMLCRPITRSQFLLGSWAARVTLALGVFLLATVPFILFVVLADRPVQESPLDVATLWGAAASVGLVALVLIFQVSLAFMLGTLLRNPLGTILVLLLIWYPLNTFLDQFRLEEFSPISLCRAIPTLAKTPAPWAKEPEEEVEEPLEEQTLPTMGEIASFALDPFGQRVKTPEPEPEPEEPDTFFDQEYEDFSLPWVLAIYGLLSAGSLGVAMLRFSRGDL